MQRVSIQGIAGSYSHAAAMKLVPGADVVETATFTEAADAVKSGKCDAAVLPIGNRIVGVIEDACNAADDAGLKKVATLRLPIEHLLIGRNGARLEEIREIRSHRHAISQCREYLSGLDALTVDHGDTALSVKSLAAANDTSIAAIGGQKAFEIYGGTVLARGIADEPDNWTEFAVFV